MSARARVPFRRGLSAAACILGLAAAASAAKLPESLNADIQRFGLDKPGQPVVRQPGAATIKALGDFRRHFGAAKASFHPRTGLPEIVKGFSAPARSAEPEAAARLFFDENLSVFGVKSAELELSAKRGTHVLFHQLHNGIPVAFSRITVQQDNKGRIRYVRSDFDPAITASPVPALGEQAARDIVAQDLGAPARARGSLVYFPDQAGGEMRLAWKFRLGGKGASAIWVYYVDALNGKVLLRYDDMRYQTFVTSGTISGGVYTLSPYDNCVGAPTRQVFSSATVVMPDLSTAVTDPTGFYSFGSTGRMTTFLRGPHVSVTNERWPNASYDNGGGMWNFVPAPFSSPHPYPEGANLAQTITGPSNAILMRAHFHDFDVGVEPPTKFEGINSQFDDDEVWIQDGSGVRVASYFGQQRGSFYSAPVVGKLLTLRLVSNNDGLAGNGFDMDGFSYFVYPSTVDASTPNPDRTTYDVYWTSANTTDSTWDEINVFYHLNLMHDFLQARSSPGQPVDLEYELPATVHHSTGLQNAFYNSDTGDIWFGDGVPQACTPTCLGNAAFDCSFALDATISHHEYTHFFMDRIYPIENFGEFGAFSEANADYWSLTSLNTPLFGQYASANGPSGAALRNLDDGIGDGSDMTRACTTGCLVLPRDYTGEIHADGNILAQALWDVRQVAKSQFPQVDVDGVMYSTLFYFPGSFREVREAFLDVLDQGYAAYPTLLTFADHAFSVHGISSTVTGEDLGSPNGGAQTAIDISTGGVRSGSIFPVGTERWYAFPAQAGTVTATLQLPIHPPAPGEYLALGMTLSDAFHRVVAVANSRPENATLAGTCPGSGDCWTGDTSVTLTYHNTAPGTLYVAVHCGYDDTGSIGGCASTYPYALTVTQTPDDSQSAVGMTVSRSGDVLNFTLQLATFSQVTPFTYDPTSVCLSSGIQGSARLLDHNRQPLYDTDPTWPNASVPLQTVTAPTLSGGVLTGAFRINPGTAARYPSVGEVFLEIVGVNPFCRRQPIGVSRALGLSSSGAGSLKAWNNVMNPVRGEHATLTFTVNGSGHTTLKLYTLRGELVKTLLDRVITDAGSVDWDGRNENGTMVASGIYLAHINGPGVSKTQKIVVVK